MKFPTSMYKKAAPIPPTPAVRLRSGGDRECSPLLPRHPMARRCCPSRTTHTHIPDLRILHITITSLASRRFNHPSATPHHGGESNKPGIQERGGRSK
ncbi:hypothetical protein VTH06DRAFT_4481 [Thermothelomyces fergusii]